MTGLSTRYVQTGPMNPVAQAGYLTAMARIGCARIDSRETDPRDGLPLRKLCAIHGFTDRCPQAA